MSSNSIIIDNFLEEEYFAELQSIIMGEGQQAQNPNQFSWFYGGDVISKGYRDDKQKSEYEAEKLYLFTHLFYLHDVPQSPMFDLVVPFVNAINNIKQKTEWGGYRIKSLIRIRANFFGNTPTLHDHQMHTDFEFPHTAAVLSLNTCNGYTKIADGTKIDSVANRVVLFNAGEDHAGSTTTNVKARFTLIINYL